MRDYYARSWRDARRIYFSQPDAVRSSTQSATWAGPTTSTYFAWMVDVETGNQARRIAECRARDAAARAARTAPSVQELLAI
ncbi:hypothetical protein Tamer19_13360 [Cupriavidus sp. TA19]|uniref:hypothetical protein n=1 Tax=unclassified Cupriavidus TaxID=2640874 RepID=UPI002729474B|nr:hypothetical protein [Cupriavidus sp. TA19]GLC91928.1 hypothetical protein Tamer19_13360 [Cupriavidus sp. TA19]